MPENNQDPGQDLDAIIIPHPEDSPEYRFIIALHGALTDYFKYYPEWAVICHMALTNVKVIKDYSIDDMSLFDFALSNFARDIKHFIPWNIYSDEELMFILQRGEEQGTSYLEELIFEIFQYEQNLGLILTQRVRKKRQTSQLDIIRHRIFARRLALILLDVYQHKEQEEA